MLQRKSLAAKFFRENIGNCAWNASTAVQLALCTGERRDRASLAWKVVGQIKERVVLPEVRNWHGKGSCCGKLTQCCQKASWQCFERSCRFLLAATSLLHNDGLILLSLDVHVVQKVMCAGTHRDWRACRTLSNNRKQAGRLMLRSWFQQA